MFHFSTKKLGNLARLLNRSSSLLRPFTTFALLLKRLVFESERLYVKILSLINVLHESRL